MKYDRPPVGLPAPPVTEWPSRARYVAAVPRPDQPRPAPATRIRPTGPRPCTLVVCRGCCCGDPRKNPGTDHHGQVRRLRAAAAASGGRFAVRASDCLGPCGQANVVVVQPSTEGRRRGARAVWVGWVLEDDAVDDLLTWAASGGPGLADPPATLTLQLVPAPARVARRR